MINEALVSLVVVRNLPFRAVEWPEFHTLCRTLNPESSGFITTAHSQLARQISSSWQSCQDIVRKKLQSAISSIHLSLDIWTSPNRYSFLGVCAHFVDYSEKRYKALLALRPVANHSGNEQFDCLLQVLKDYGVVRKLGVVIGDNSSTNDVLCRTIEDYLKEYEDIEWNSMFQRIRCTGHIINLAVQAFLFKSLIETDQLEAYDQEEENGDKGDEEKRRLVFRLLGPLGKLHNLVKDIRGSASRTKEFKDMAKRIVPLDNRTRWNSWYELLCVADQLAGSIDIYSKNHFARLKDDYLNPTDWEQLRTIKTFLQPFYRATLETEGDKATIDRVLFTMDVLVEYFRTSLLQYSSNQEFCSRIRIGWETFDKYYHKTDDSPFYAAALILHPNRRTKYIQANWKPKWVRPILKKVKELWEKYREQSLASYEPVIQSPIEPEQEPDIFDQIAKDLGKYTRPASQDEYDDYCNGEPYDIGKKPALEW